MKIKFLFIAVIPYLLANLLSCQKKGTMDIYLAIGQSNMAGRAEVMADLKAPMEGIYLFTGEGWELAKNPMNMYSSIRKDSSMQKLSPAYAFARKLRAHTGNDIGMVVNAKGGTSIHEWMPGTHFFEEIVSRALKAAESGNIKGVIWHQGESDVGQSDEYLELLQRFIGALRKDLDQEHLPFVAGQVSEDKIERKGFNAMLLNLPQKVPFTEVVLSYGTTTFDSTHFDSPSQVLLGERYAEKMMSLIKK